MPTINVNPIVDMRVINKWKWIWKEHDDGTLFKARIRQGWEFQIKKLIGDWESLPEIDVEDRSELGEKE